MTVPLAAPGRWFTAHAVEVSAALERVSAGGRYILGPEVEAFESAFAAFCKRSHGIAVASGTDALMLSLMALDAKDAEVITSAHTAVATLTAIERAGAKPVLADIDPRTRCLDPDSVERLMNSRTRAIVPVHMYGHPADMDALQALVADTSVAIVEDCAQAHGAQLHGKPVGSMGIAGAFSFYPTKNIGAMGDAGAIVTDDADLACALRALRQYGWDDCRLSHAHGCNSRMDDIQAALLRLKLAHFDHDFTRRQSIAQQYSKALAAGSSTRAPYVACGAVHAFHLYVVETVQWRRLADFLTRRGIASGRYYDCPGYGHPAYALVRRDASMASVESFYERHLALPVSPELTDTEVAAVCEALAEWVQTDNGGAA